MIKMSVVSERSEEKVLQKLKRLQKMGAVREQLTPSLLKKAEELGIPFEKSGELIDFAEIARLTGLNYAIVHGVFVRVNPEKVRDKERYISAIEKIKKVLREKGYKKTLRYVERFERILKKEEVLYED